MTYNLDAFLSTHAFAFMMLFSRLGAVMMLFPGIGESYVPPRVRMMLTFMMSLLLLGPMLPQLPALPSSPAMTAQLIGYEIIIGLFFGTLVRLLNSALEAAGMVIGITTGLSNATILNPAQASQSPLSTAFLSMAGLCLIFVTGLDHFLLRSAVALYNIFPAGGPFMPGDMAQTVINLTNRSFVVGIELAAPFLIVGLLLDTALGLLQRLLPQIQVYMVSMPVQIWGGLTLLSLTATGILAVWLRFFDQSITSFFQG